MADFPLYLTYDDVLLLPQYSEILPRNVDTRTLLTKHIKLNVPLLSAAMDTVTEHELAIKMALYGGIGIIHKNLTPDQQAEEVSRVKRFENGFIRSPICAKPTDKIQDIYEIRQKYGYKAVPITDNGKADGILVGLVTANDYFIHKHANLKVKDRMTKSERLLTAHDGISLGDANDILEESKHSKLIIVDKKTNRLRAMVTRRDIEKNKLYPDSCKDSDKRLRVGAAVGPAKNMEERVEKLARAGVDVLVVDTAHGHSKGVIDTIKYIKKNYKKMEVIGGNIATGEAVQALVKAGADAVKVGIGPGSICTTRVVTGIGAPQFSAVMECVKEAKKTGTPVIADGGIKYSGDMAKAIAAGASSAMVGSLFAGTKESPGDLIYHEGKTFKAYRGMGSMGAMSGGGKERYGQDDVKSEEKYVPEGIEGQIVYKGPVAHEIFQLIGGLRSSMGYVGAKDIPTFHKKAKFVQITNAGLLESHPHDVMVTKDAPNYKSSR
ncbi:IMP dehydrogenase [Patescibacteria group bacterium]|nr:IMP dehydrogenase [Patescibacteria group bacterium]MBU1015789.1 IMP dehydrogenase [Patescibacteria group bacterium]MBU1685342.1 IMP dehydrogenase [Patescibacteria group bacterium]MBU1938270.1 IMP dehydrogenase [Patescibacteria group bacterium]